MSTRMTWPGCAVAIFAATVGSGLAQYAVATYTADNGGGVSTGGVYAVHGTIGQPDAGAVLAGGTLALSGGFWTVGVVQTTGAPHLQISVESAESVTLSWEPDSPGWVLQQFSISSGNVWVDAPSGSTNPVSVPVTGVRTFYQLYRP